MQDIKSFLKTIVVFLVVALSLRASVVEAFKIPSSSMVPTLQVGDHILVNKLSYGLRIPFKDETVKLFSQPERGDVVVFTLPDNPATPENEADTNIIKRVVALPGDVVEVRGMQLIINGEVQPDEHSTWLDGGKRDFGPEMVPSGRVLLLGDNRDQSKDSRYWDDPFLEIERIKGRAFIIYWNFPAFRRAFKVIE